MNSLESIASVVRDDSSVITVGVFDGVHEGHRAILDHLLKRSAIKRGSSTVVTFDPHPREIVGPSPVSLLTTIEERTEILGKMGIQRVVVIPFTREFSQTNAEEFVVDTLINRVGMQEIVVGHDHHFGKGRQGNETKLLEMASDHQFAVDVIPAKVLDRAVVSSSRIRKTIEGVGNMELASVYLGYRFGITAEVIKGAGRGREIGFPTANLRPIHDKKIIPQNGVYAVTVKLEDRNTTYTGMMNIGFRPTFEGNDHHLEVHIMDLNQDLYGSKLRIEFVSRIRSEKKFEGIEALAEQLNEDRGRCIASVKSKP
ncbi:MAG: bifunctional riboflavin kinase/FAD synthetase [Rhodothermia bacterium]|nr:MAG: bifunctional riboflavin kinase/FAD synthetase [Rhodothermia bacterium]